jgi:hypothetical protein
VSEVCRFPSRFSRNPRTPKLQSGGGSDREVATMPDGLK